MLTQFLHILKSGFLKFLVRVFSLFIILSTVAEAKEDNLFRSDKIIRMELRSDFSAIQKERTGAPEYHNGELIYSIGFKKIKIPVRVIARGNFRLNPENCQFPPLYINFKKVDDKNSLFNNQDRLKLVTPCQSDELVVEEYLVYKLYHQVTEMSLDVRLVTMVYFDTGTNTLLFEKYSYFIEDKERFAKRVDARENNEFMTPYDLDRESFKKLSVFQYMIGNADWFITPVKNILLVQPNDLTKSPVAVPYDFDYTDFLNADYTKIKGLPDNLVSSRRVYRGICLTMEELDSTLRYFREMRPVFESIINKNRILDKLERIKLLSFIGEFYSIIENPDEVKQRFIDSCLKEEEYHIKDE